MYYDYSENIKYIKPHRVLALNRGEKEGVLGVSIDNNNDEVINYLKSKLIKEKPACRLVTDLGSILECLYEVYGTDGTMLIAGNKLSDTVIYPFIRMIKKKCKAVDAEKLNLMLWKIYMVSSRKKEFVTAAKKELQPYLTKKDEKQIDTTYDTTYTIDRRH